jgi:hypothetical protein
MKEICIMTQSKTSRKEESWSETEKEKLFKDARRRRLMERIL